MILFLAWIVERTHGLEARHGTIEAERRMV